jgi:hypothetical protein
VVSLFVAAVGFALARFPSPWVRMSRSSSLSQTLLAPSRFEVRAVPPTGDCLYDCLDLQLLRAGRSELTASPRAMRDAVADALNEDTFALYAMCGQAGVEGFEFMTHHHRAPQDLAALKAFARISGRDAGAGRCLWADDFALRTMSVLCDVRILIVDEQAAGCGSRSGRRRGNDVGAPDSRFVCLGEASPRRCVLLHRSRREHFSAVFFDGRGVFDAAALPRPTLELWPSSCGLRAGAGADATDGDAPCAAAGVNVGSGSNKRRRR